tara:strand:- start:280 stop:906 length:627 start_codon:yes stop_codon:yes gene_type:complete
MRKSKKSKKSKSWVIKQHRDQFYKRSKTLGYRSRSAFKLIELNKKFNFINKNTNFLDIGSCPGGWSQVASQIIDIGKMVSVDIKKMNEIKNVKFINADFLTNETKDKISLLFANRIDVIVSDMAANTTGNKNLDCIRTNMLCADVINFSTEFLKKEGVLVAKLFMGEDFIEVKKLAKKKFKRVDFFKPDSSRDESKETYIHCKSLKTL